MGINNAPELRNGMDTMISSRGGRDSGSGIAFTIGGFTAAGSRSGVHFDNVSDGGGSTMIVLTDGRFTADSRRTTETDFINGRVSGGSRTDFGNSRGGSERRSTTNVNIDSSGGGNRIAFSDPSAAASSMSGSGRRTLVGSGSS